MQWRVFGIRSTSVVEWGRATAAHADREGVRVLTVPNYEAGFEMSALTRCQDTASQCGLIL